MTKPRILQVLINLVVLDLLALISLVVYWRLLRGKLIEPRICFSEKDLNSIHKNYDSLKRLFDEEVKSKDTDQYCVKISDILSNYINKTITDRYDSNINPEYSALDLGVVNCFVNNEEADQLHLRQISSHSKPVPGRKTKVYWGSEVYSGNKVSHAANDGEIHIKRTGKYFISLMMTTRFENSTELNENIDQTVSHVVNCVSNKNGSLITLLEHVESVCEMSVEHADRTSNIGAVFHLEEHDRIFAATSDPYNIVVGRQSNHISIHRV
ncbi:uncharacterized protein LOC132726585 [Ruditapes philippinarum]|uniref:uncharacterized protein LOC132726585 n=1 Tax=Ruditapes philippinarum TaxID=129788 RepID=UPI00295BB6DD|nr:uncharacterized protein LOC132726585 [Ruditapes philippinarum]